MRAALALLVVTVIGCGGKSSDLEGFYAVDAWNENPTSCADPGPSVLASHDPLFFIRMDSFGQSFLNVVGCADQTECELLAGDEDTLQLGMFILPDGNDDDGWTGKFIFAFPGSTPGTCSGEVANQRLTRDGDTAVAVRIEHTEVPSFPERGGMCETDDADDAAAELPCTRLEVVHANLTAPL